MTEHCEPRFSHRAPAPGWLKSQTRCAEALIPGANRSRLLAHDLLEHVVGEATDDRAILLADLLRRELDDVLALLSVMEAEGMKARA
ncbi:hypothetical protein [Lentisalinibacter orientalis]|uniref:hypothetical protein n=1 Tax=Lentisalinibacter orientalis TaxID=2992241 RepID=UPI00386D45E0